MRDAYHLEGPSHDTRDIRERAGLLPNTEVEFSYDGEVVRLLRTEHRTTTGRGARLVAQLRWRGTAKLSTDEIMALTRSDKCRPS